MPLNIEKSGFRRSQYVGYGLGKVWTIKRVRHAGVWRATALGEMPREHRTLVGLGKAIA